MKQDLGHMFIVKRPPEYHLYSQKKTSRYGRSMAVCGKTTDPDVRIIRDRARATCQYCRSAR